MMSAAGEIQGHNGVPITEYSMAALVCQVCELNHCLLAQVQFAYVIQIPGSPMFAQFRALSSQMKMLPKRDRSLK